MESFAKAVFDVNDLEQLQGPAVLQSYLVQNVDTPARVMDGNAVIITPHDAVLHTMNDVGTFIWARADGTKTVEQIVAQLVEEFDVTLEQAMTDARGFIEACVQRGLMHLSPVPEPVDLTPVLAGANL